MNAAGQTRGPGQPVKRTVRAEQGTSSSEARIAPTTMKAGSSSIETGGDRWIARGYDLKTLISQIYDVDARRIDFAGNGPGDARYDVTLKLPREVDEDAMRRMLEQALERKFRLAIAAESKTLDVYVLTAPNGPGAELHRHASSQHSPAGKASMMALESGDVQEDEERITVVGRNCAGVPSGGGITASAGTMPDLGRTLEPDLDRPMVDETRLMGSYDFQVGSYDNKESLFKLLHDQLGILVTPAQRQVTVLTVRPAGDEQEMRAALE